MARYDFSTRRLFVDAPLIAGARVGLNRDQSNYLSNVLRLEAGAGLLVFNGHDGEWRARLALAGKRDVALELEALERPQTATCDLRLLFAPLKHARLDYMIQKAVEMGAGRLSPVLTRRTQVHKLNLDRVRANAIEAAEQCGILTLPDIDEPAPLDRVLMDLPEERFLVFCDEDAPVADPLIALGRAIREDRVPSISVLIGPEGGFDPAERDMLLALPGALPISLGPRILRADTAAVAALALVQAALGDWRGSMGDAPPQHG